MHTWGSKHEHMQEHRDHQNLQGNSVTQFSFNTGTSSDRIFWKFHQNICNYCAKKMPIYKMKIIECSIYYSTTCFESETIWKH